MRYFAPKYVYVHLCVSAQIIIFILHNYLKVVSFSHIHTFMLLHSSLRIRIYIKSSNLKGISEDFQILMLLGSHLLGYQEILTLIVQKSLLYKTCNTPLSHYNLNVKCSVIEVNWV